MTLKQTFLQYTCFGSSGGGFIIKLVHNSHTNGGFKFLTGLNPPIVWEFHERKHVTYNLRIQNLCKLPPFKAMNFDLDSISFRGSLLWNTVDDSIKREKTLACF